MKGGVQGKGQMGNASKTPDFPMLFMGSLIFDPNEVFAL
jgi:hypothetical protein